ncbi:MAG: hypothetical protein RML84_11330, partial [Anaerolineae bacterium]|nr:hypothetical protein [Anaerolineae bacterium]
SIGQMAALSEEVAAGAEEVNAVVQEQAHAVAAVNERMRATAVTAEQLIRAIRQFKLDSAESAHLPAEATVLRSAA